MKKCIFTITITLSFLILAYAQPVLKLESFASGNLSNIIGISHAGDDRLFAVMQNGVIRVVETDGNVIQTPFLNVVSRISTGGERGLLGLAFHPEYLENGYFYINYTRTGGNTIVSRWSVSIENPNLADPNSEEVLLEIAQPYSNHNGGDLKFGPDGYLYIGTGDGGSGGDPQNYSQNPLSLLGKMLRIDVDSEFPYAIPEDNPFIGSSDTLPEIWALGLRNPWRYSFDRLNGDLWIADVGQNMAEEVNRVAGSGQGGDNYGWRCYEAVFPYNTNGCLPAENYIMPVYYYTHTNGDKSITGGYVYRGEEYPLLYGTYICSDFLSGRFFTVTNEDEEWIGQVHNSFGEFQFATFGEDIHGNIYAGARGQGVIYKVKEFCSDFIPTIALDEDILEVTLRSGTFSEDITLEWYLNGELSELPGDSIVYLEENGTYQVKLTHEEGCEIWSNEVIFESTSIEKVFNSTSVIIFPNPATNSITLRIDAEGQHDFQFIDWKGQIVYSGTVIGMTDFPINPELQPGVYILGISGETGRVTRKVLIF